MQKNMIPSVSISTQGWILNERDLLCKCIVQLVHFSSLLSEYMYKYLGRLYFLCGLLGYSLAAVQFSVALEAALF